VISIWQLPVLAICNRGITRPIMTQQVGRAQHGPTYNGPIDLYRLSILSGRAQQTFSRAYALLGPPVDMPLICNHVNDVLSK